MFLLNKLKSLIRTLLFYPAIFKQIVKLFREVAHYGRGSNECLSQGFLPMPVHYYSPLPDINDLEKREIWNVRSEIAGIDFRVNSQLDLLKELGSNYADECQWPAELTDNLSEYYVNNPSFSYGCAASTHSMIRKFKPNTIIEIGSGMSSRVISSAIKLDSEVSNSSTEYFIIDPYPSEFIKSRLDGVTKVIEKKVELNDLAFFDKLKENDILFIDSGHCVKIGGDVNYLFLDILPRLSPGVVIHVHDINLPYEYPKVYATGESFRQFWTEQYLLQSFLAYNNEFEVLLAMNYLMVDHIESFVEAFPHYDPEKHKFTSCSFWFRRKPRGA